MPQKIEIPVKGMDCAGCAKNVQSALEKVEGVQSVEVLLSAEKARLVTDSKSPDHQAIKKAVESIGYHIPDLDQGQAEEQDIEDMARKSFRLFGLVFGGILFIVVAGEWLGLFQTVTGLIPFWVGAILVLIAGYPVFKQVIVAASKKLVTPHALMALGAVAALVAGSWVTAAIVVFFMRTGDYIESYTTDKARDSVRSLTEFAPQKATVIQNGMEKEISINEVRTGDLILVRPGGKIPVDGRVMEGAATVDQSPITGESMPVEMTVGSKVFASTIARGGRLLIQAEAVGQDSTFGKIIRMVEEAEAQKGEVQRFADRFSGYYLPVVAGIAALTYIISGDVMSTVAVMVVACACAFALATPVALLASIGSKAKQGLLIKGGKYIEALARADVLLIDKTGTLTFGRPEITDVISLNGCPEGDLLLLAASAEQYSEHPLGKAVVKAANDRFLALKKTEDFKELTANGVSASVNGQLVTVGNERLAESSNIITQQIADLKKAGKTVITVQRDGTLIGLLAARDAERKEVGAAIENIRKFGFRHIELLTGDNKETAQALAGRLGIEYRAELLPEEKIAIVKKYQSEGRTVVMVGDGINDAPALAQADVGIAMGTTGTDVAIETADVTLMRDDWSLIPELFKTARKTMRVIKWNFGFTTVYNVVGLSLAAFGILPPILAAAAQSIPDVGILLNSARLLKR
ncbi:MAG TPA: cation-translocating P-type ATPase [Balneolaceae bacterium]|nr:cation-translocating P-type ATPase [Balneolaceae bacterium]